MKIKINEDSKVNLFLVEAIGRDLSLLDKIITDKFAEDGSPIYDIQFIVNGYEFDFNKVVENLISSFESAIEENAKDIIINKIDDLSNLLDDLKERIINEKEKFKYKY